MREGYPHYNEDRAKLTVFQNALEVLNKAIQTMLDHFGQQLNGETYNPSIQQSVRHLHCLLKKMHDELYTTSPKLQHSIANQTIQQVLEILHIQQQVRAEAIQQLSVMTLSLEQRAVYFYKKLEEAQALQQKIEQMLMQAGLSLEGK